MKVRLRRNNMGLKWNDSEDIGLALFVKYPEVNPLTVRFTDLLSWIIKLKDFEDDSNLSSEGKLESIQMAWLEEYNNK
jgi:FeS assembly protein IscX